MCVLHEPLMPVSQPLALLAQIFLRSRVWELFRVLLFIWVALGFCRAVVPCVLCGSFLLGEGCGILVPF